MTIATHLYTYMEVFNFGQSYHLSISVCINLLKRFLAHTSPSASPTGRQIREPLVIVRLIVKQFLDVQVRLDMRCVLLS